MNKLEMVKKVVLLAIEIEQSGLALIHQRKMDEQGFLIGTHADNEIADIACLRMDLIDAAKRLLGIHLTNPGIGIRIQQSSWVKMIGL